MPGEGRWRIRSVRARTTFISVVVVGATLTIGAVGLILLLHNRLLDSIDRTATTRAEDVAALIASGIVPAELTLGDDEAVVQVLDASGEIVASTPATLERIPPLDVSDSDEPTVFDAVAVEVDDDGDDAGDEDGGQPEVERTAVRAAAVQVEGSSERYVVVAAEQRDDADETVGAVVTALLVALPVVVLIVALLTWSTAGRALRPVHHIAAKVSGIRDDQLGERVPVPLTGDEITHLAVTMNAMLDRLQASLDRQRRFTADASHELRTPLTSLRAQIEIAVLDPGRVVLHELAPDLLADVGRLERLITDLLALARLDATAMPRSAVDLGALITDELARAPRERLLALQIPSDRVWVDGSPDQLRRAVRNLVDNGQRHATTEVLVTLMGDDDHAVLEVRDDGPGIAADQRERVFERFTRLDDARAADDGGSGLGLAITRAIVEAHGGTIRLEPNDREGHGTVAVIVLPRARQQAGRPPD